MRPSLLALIFVVALAGCESVPGPVTEKIHALEAECRKPAQKDAPLKTDLKIVQRVDLNGDEQPDYIFSDSDVACDAGASFRHGNGGTGVVIFATTPDGIKQAFSETVWDYYLRYDSSPAVAWVRAGGRLCGQASFNGADARQCDRALVWNAKTQTFNLSPLSEAQFLE